MAKLIFYLLVIPTYLFSLLPLKFHYVISDIIAFTLRAIVNYRGYVVYINLSRSFPELKYKELKKLSKEFYTYMSDTIVETIWSISKNSKQLSKIVEIENPQILKEIYDTGQSVIVVLGHQGNWELLGSLPNYTNNGSLGFTKKHSIFIYKQVKSKAFDLLTNWIRERHKISLLESNDTARYMIKNKSSQNCYFLISDQSPLPGSRFVVDFLSQKTLMINGPEQLSKMLNVPIVYLNMHRKMRGKYIVSFTTISKEPKIEPQGFITNKFASLLEEGIKANPSSWLWSHKRWKRGLEESKTSIKNNRDE